MVKEKVVKKIRKLSIKQVQAKIKKISKLEDYLEQKKEIIELSKKCEFGVADLNTQLAIEKFKIKEELKAIRKNEEELKKQNEVRIEPKKEPLILEIDESNPKLAEIQEVIQLRASVLEFLSQKHPDRNSATELLTKAVQIKNIFYSIRDDIKSETWVYENGIYIPNGRSVVNEFCREILLKAYTESLANQVYNKIKEDNKINQEDFFKSDYPDEVPVLNGILNTRTKELNEFDPEKIFFNKIPVEFKPELKCEKLDQFFKDVLADENDIKVFYEIIGDGLSKKYEFQKCIIQYGMGSNGKGISQSVIKKFFGSENCSSVSLTQMYAKSNSVANLFGKYMNLAGDLDRQALRETGMFKELTSGTDYINAPRKYLNDLNFLNFSKMVFACNEFPKVYDTTFGFWRRWIILNYPFRFVSQEEYDNEEDKTNLKIKNPQIFDEITTEEEMSGLLNKALEGLERLRKQKGYSNTKGTEEIKNFWIRKSSPFTAFCIDCVEEDFEGNIFKNKLRLEFSKYCKSHKVGGIGDKELKATLQDMFGASEDRKMIGDKLESIWEGIKLKENYKDFISKNNKISRLSGLFEKPKEKGCSIDFQENHDNPDKKQNEVIDSLLKEQIEYPELSKGLEDFE